MNASRTWRSGVDRWWPCNRAGGRGSDKSNLIIVQLSKDFLFTELKLNCMASTKLELPAEIHEKSFTSA